MAEYETSLPMNVPPDRVFDFVADVRNLPRYLPMVQYAEPQGANGGVRIQGKAQGGRAFDADGWLRLDRTEWRMEWGTNEHSYRGWMEIEGAGDQCLVTLHLSFAGSPATGAQQDLAIEQALDAGLASLRALLEEQPSRTEATAPAY